LEDDVVNVNKQLKKGSTRVFFYFDKTTEQVHVAIKQLQYCWYINFKKFNNIYPEIMGDFAHEYL
jgi:hypothetical protein